VDASHQSHDDCCSHTGAILTFGAGSITSSSNKQKLKTKSSIELKLIVMYNKLDEILWTHHFLEAQGYMISAKIVFQDNMSTLSCEKNSHISSSKVTKYIKAKYFSIQHYYQTGDIDLCYCPTDNMWADILTKPLQGSKFHQLRAFLMNCPISYSKDPPMVKAPIVKSPINILMKQRIPQIAAPPQECVEVSSS
jgi:hypothetical protein